MFLNTNEREGAHRMSLTQRLESLLKRHQDLDEAIRQEETRSATDPTVIRALKRDKLHLKEEIEGVRAQIDDQSSAA